ncbi:MAG TPA: hypothetical protein VFV08_02650, partial [Puia sp.]|nr:hypothetical protein [Puia sp.]
MRNLILLCTASFFSFAVPAQSPEDLKLVRAAVESFVNDFNNGGFPNASTYATTDWIHINPIGGMTRGRENV